MKPICQELATLIGSYEKIRAPSVCSFPTRLFSALFPLLSEFFEAPFSPYRPIPESLLSYHVHKSYRMLHPRLSSLPPDTINPSSCCANPSLVEYHFAGLTSDHVANSLRPHRSLSAVLTCFSEHHPPSPRCPRTHIILFLPTCLSHVFRLLIDRLPSVRLHLNQKRGTTSGNSHSQHT